MYLNVSHEFGKSCIYIKNKSGPKIEPCGTPVVMGMVSEKTSKTIKSRTCQQKIAQTDAKCNR